jgi:LmbE family N-acetylglucosaminyl deacetylase
MRVLCVAAHPDDELLGVGGTLLRHVAEGDDVHILIACTNGLRDRMQRLDQARLVARSLGATVDFGWWNELGYVVPEIDVKAAEIVYTHHPGDLNRDHRLVAEGVAVACRPYTSDVRSLRYFETPSSTEWGEGFTPNLFVDIGDHMERKLALLGHYAAEMRPAPHPRSDESLRSRASFWGSVSGFGAAEPFVIGRDRW